MLIVMFLFVVVLCVINGAIANYKNRSVVAWVLLTLVFGLIATLVVSVMPAVPEDESWKYK